MTSDGWRVRIQALLLFALGTVAASGASEPVIRFDPPLPGPEHRIRISVGYFTNCFLSASAAVTGALVDVTAVEGCICPASLPEPFAFTVETGPLAPGAYSVRFLVTTTEEAGVGCQDEPELLATRELVVSPSGSLPAFSVEPPEPTAEDAVTLVLESQCHRSFETPLVQDRLVRLTEVPSLILAPCSQLATWRAEFPLGQLPPATYTALHVFDDGSVPPQIVAVHTFEVAASATVLPLRHGRFALSVSWSDTTKGTAGSGQAVRLSEDSGYFWFFRPGNLEVVVKVLNGCKINGHYWVFASGLTDLQTELRVEDLQSGAYRTYVRFQGTPFEPVLDTTAFATCP